MKIDEKELIDKYFPEALEATKQLVSIPSYTRPASADAPYGKAVKDVLIKTLDIAKSLGFETYKDKQNRYGYVDYGTGKELFAILCHLDVVPAGNIKEWKNDPFTPIVKDGNLYGRGSFDDKGPAMMNLYALKYLKDHHYVPKDYKIRIIFGLTEETTWESIKAYIKDFGTAKHGYVPDGEFPVVYAEKWIVDYDIYGKVKTDYTIKGGSAYNVVTDYVTYKGPHIDEITKYLNDHSIKTEVNKDGSIGVKGTTGHGSLPWLGINAATHLGMAMKSAGMKDNVIDFLVELHENWDLSPYFNGTEDESGKLTQNLGIIDVENGKQRFAFTFRVPVFTEPKSKFLPKLEELLKKYNFTGKPFSIENSVYEDVNSPLIKNIMKVYQEVTGDLESKPIATGGGTYAKAMPGLVAFGAEFDNTNSTMHAYNEWVSLDDLKKDLEIYTKAIVLLTE